MNDIKIKCLQMLVVKVVNDVIYDFRDYQLSPCDILSWHRKQHFLAVESPTY